MHQLVLKGMGTNLSKREIEVTTLIGKGDFNKEIAYKLGITEGTVKIYLSRIFLKLGVSNRTQLAIWAIHNISV